MRSYSPEAIGVLLATMGVLLGAMFKAGKWRERLDSTKRGLTLEVRSLADSTNQRLDRVDGRLSGIEGQFAAMADRHAASERWKGFVDTLLQGITWRLEQVERSAGTTRRGLA